MRIALLFIYLCIASIVCAKQKNSSNDKQRSKNAALEQQLLEMAVRNSLLNTDVRQKFLEEIGKYVVNSASDSLGKFNLTMNCIKGMVELLKGISGAKPWAIQMLDSFGKLPSGITRGTVGALGDYDVCLGVTVQNLHQKTENFKGKYCLVEFLFSGNESGISKYLLNRLLQPTRHSRKLQPQTSICIPSTCTREDAQSLLLKIMPSLGLDARVKSCESLNDEINFTSFDKLLFFVLSTLFLVVVVATFLHLMQEFTGSRTAEKEEQSSDGFLQHFSLLRNAQRLFKKENNPDTIRIFHGIRVLSTIWLISSHILNVMFDQAFGGLHTFFTLRKFIWPQFIPSSSMAVETFFFMSAVLLAYNVTKNKDRPITISLAFQRRYIRTTIPLLLMIGCTCLLPFLSSGPLYKEIIGSEAEKCKHLGWLNLFYIHNFIPFQKVCMVSTWYLAADTQLFLISLFVLVPYRKNPEMLVKLTIGLFLFGIFGKIISIIFFSLPPTALMLEPQFENLSYVWQRSYFSPVFHLSTYSIGMLVGYMLAAKKQIYVSKMTSNILWMISILIQLFVVFGVYVWNSAEEPPGLIPSLLYGVTHRVLWALTLAWMTFSCQANDKNLLSRFLGAEAFVPISRVTYMAYLTNFTVKHLYVGTTRSIIIYDFWSMTTMMITVTTVTFFISAMLTLIFESPFLSIEKAFLNRIMEKKNLKKQTEEKKD